MDSSSPTIASQAISSPAISSPALSTPAISAQTVHLPGVPVPVGESQALGIEAPGIEAPGIEAYLAQPVEPGDYAGIIVLQEVFGVNAHIRAVTERLASQGYRAIAPALYQRTAPGFEVGYGPEDLVLGRRYKDLTTAAELLADIQAAIAYLQTQPSANSAPIGCIGFCFGGHVAYLAATLSAIQATAVFYGAGIPHFTPGGGPPTLSRTGEIQGTLYGFFGEKDPLIPGADVAAIAQALATHHIPHQIHCYPGAGHGFFCDQRADYNREAATTAWETVTTLFRSTLQKN